MSDSTDFLKALRDGPHNVVAIEPDSGLITAITTTDYDEIEAFVDRFNGKRNLYYSVNRPRAGAPNRKLTKGDIEACEFLYVDIDPPPDGTNADIDLDAIWESDPSFIVDSGNGYNVLWRIDPTGAETAEAHGRGLVKRYGGDPGVWDAPRILRLPGTVNLPTAKKRKAGRVPVPARLIHKDLISSHDPRDLAEPLPAPEQSSGPTNIDIDEARAYLEIDDLPRQLKGRIDRAVASDEQFALHFSGKNPEGDESRSGVSFAIAKDMHRLGFEDQEIANTLHAHPSLYGPDWDLRKLSRDAGRSARDYSAFELTQAQVEQIMRPKPKRPKTKLKIVYSDEVTLSTKPRYLVKGVLDEHSNAVLYGKSNTGKSFLALDISMAIATGTKWGGRKVKQGAVLYLAAEAGDGIAHRLIASQKRYGVVKPAQAPFAYIPQPVNLLRDAGAAEAVLEALREAQAVLAQPIALIVFDTLAKVMAGGNENASEDMTNVADAIARIGLEAGCSTLTVHHSGKQQAAGMRGHSSLQASIDTELECVRLGDDGMSGPGVVKPRKQREMGKDNGDIGFSLAVVELGHDDEGDAITTCHPVMESEHGFDAIEMADREKILESSPDMKALYGSLLTATEAIGGLVPAAAWVAQWLIDTEAYEGDCGKLATLKRTIVPKSGEKPVSIRAILGNTNSAMKKRLGKSREKLVELGLVEEVIENRQNILYRPK